MLIKQDDSFDKEYSDCVENLSNQPVKKVITQDDNIFPVDSFPKEIIDYIRTLENSSGFHPEMLAACILGVASAAIGNAVTLKVRNNWTEKLNLWICIVAESGIKKSPAFKSTFFPIEDKQKEAAEAHKIEIHAHKFNKKEDGPIPRMIKHYVSDFTIEALSGHLNRSERGLIVKAEEMTGWIKSMGAYKKASGDKQKWLSLYGCDPISVERVGSGDIYIPNPFVSVLGTTQPQEIGLEISKNTYDGFYQRIMFAYPRNIKNPGWGKTEVDLSKKTAYGDLIDGLFGMGETKLTFHSEAINTCEEWVNEMALISNEGSTILRSIVPKIQSVGFKVAAILHCLEGNTSNEISKSTLLKAIKVAKYFHKSAVNLYRDLLPTAIIKSMCKRKAKAYSTVNEYFTRKEYLKAAMDAGATRRTAYSWLTDRQIYGMTDDSEKNYRKLL